MALSNRQQRRRHRDRGDLVKKDRDRPGGSPLLAKRPIGPAASDDRDWKLGDRRGGQHRKGNRPPP
jgi:hypothetical protein